MGMEIRLLGEPRILDDQGAARPVRGHQAWALLARILLSRRPLGRREIAAELFPEAADPLGALRWCLAALRRALGCAEALSGDPITVNLPRQTRVDVFELDDGGLDVEAAGDLLQGIEPRCGHEFATWLLVERERMASVIDARIRQETMQAIAGGDHARAIRLAERGVRRNPFDEGPHIFLVKSLVLAGRHEAALKHVEQTERLFLDELGERPSPALRSSARRTVAAPPGGVSPQAVVKSLIDSGLAALAAGAVDAGVDCLRRAVADAERCNDAYLQTKALLELGTALVHAVRGHDDEGAILLRQAIDLARRCGSEDLAASGFRELGYVDALAGRRPAAAAQLTAALEIAGDDDGLAGIHAVMGFNLVDWGRVEEGMYHYDLSLRHARAAGNLRRQIWSLGLGGWGQLAAGRADRAVRWLSDCLEMVDQTRWISFRPWPLAVLGEARLRQRQDPVPLRAALEDAFALSCQLGDPCWEGAVARSLALSYDAAGEAGRALHWLAEARGRCLRETDAFVGLLVQILADQAAISLRDGRIDAAGGFAREALARAARAHMDGHVRQASRLIDVCNSKVQD